MLTFQVLNFTMSIHEEVLSVARRLCGVRQSLTFTPAEIVAALPHLNERSVRTHVVSRCCVNAPGDHAHRWPYFRRQRRGVYEIQPEYRVPQNSDVPQVAEPSPAYELSAVVPRQAIHAVVFESEDQYVGECLEIAIVTQGASLDETVANLREAIELYMSGEDPDVLGIAPNARLVVTLETSTGPL